MATATRAKIRRGPAASAVVREHRGGPLLRSLRIVTAVAAATLVAVTGSSPALASDTSRPRVPSPRRRPAAAGVHVSGRDLQARSPARRHRCDLLLPTAYLYLARDPSAPTEFLYGGSRVITITHGCAQMLSHDTGVLYLEGTVNPFVTTVSFVTGIQQCSGVHCTLVAFGNAQLRQWPGISSCG